MAGSIKAVIFDFGGVLIEWDPRRVFSRYFPGQPRAMEQFLTEINFSEWNSLQDKGRPFAEGIAVLSAAFPQYANSIRAYWERWEDSIGGPILGSVWIMQRLKQAGYALYGLSNWSAETYPIIKDRYDFFGLFDGIIISGEVKLIKPDPAIFNLAQKILGLPPSDCLLIDDSPVNIAAARQLGYLTILFQSPEQLEQEIFALQLLSPFPSEARRQ